MTREMDLRIWVEGVVAATTAMALSFLPIEFANSDLDLSLGMVPLVLYSFRRGLLPGVAADFVRGVLNIILGTVMKNLLSVSQVIFEYPFTFASEGMDGTFARKIQLYFQASCLKSAICTIILGSVVAVFVCWFQHFRAGVLVWGMYAPKGMNSYLYSFILSGTGTVVNCLYASLVLGLLAKVAPQLLVPKKQVGP